MTASEQWQSWLDRYGDYYETDEQRVAAFGDFKANRAQYRQIFGLTGADDEPAC